MKIRRMFGIGLVCTMILMMAGVADLWAADTKPLVLRFAEMSPPAGNRAFYLEKTCKEVEKATEGRIKIEIYWSDTLVKNKEMPRALKDGICDIAWVGGSNHPAEVPLWTIFTYFLYNPKGDDAAWLVRKGWEFFDNCEPMRKDFERLGQTAWFFIPYDSFALYSKKAVKGLDDMKGMRIRIVGEGYMKMLNAIGVHPQFIPASDLYPAMERGTVDGAITGWEMGKRYRFYEVVPYITDTAVTFALSSNNVALAAVKKMSEKDRKIFFDIGRRMSIEYGDSEKIERANYKTFMQEKGLKILPFPAQDREKWANMPEVKGLVKSWVETQNRAGRPGTEVMKTFVKIFEMPAWMVEGL